MTLTPSPFLQITRPGNVIITGLTVYVGGLIASRGEPFPILNLLLPAISAALIAAGANALNDYYDVATDLINRPNRAIPSGRLSRAVAGVWGWLLTCIGLAVGFWVDTRLGLMAFGVGVLLWLYNSRLKQTYFWGNLSVAVCGGAAFIYGGLAVGKVSASLIPATFAMLIHLAREIVKDVDDVSGDMAAGSRTIPIVSGKRTALNISALILILLSLATPLPYFLGDYSAKYLALVSFSAAFPLLILSFFMVKGLTAEGVKRVGNILKIIMITGLLALYVG